MDRVVLASRNPHKLRELAALLPGWPLEPLERGDYPEETGSTFAENARAKAAFARRFVTAAWILAEDSGLEVDGLGGRPGVYSARFAGPGATDEENVRRLLEELGGAEGAARRARYVCELVAVTPAGEELEARGVLAGRIARQPRGSGGFGYDPVFVPEGAERTVAELGDAWKAERSHRAQAARALRAAVERR